MYETILTLIKPIFLACAGIIFYYFVIYMDEYEATEEVKEKLYKTSLQLVKTNKRDINDFFDEVPLVELTLCMTGSLEKIKELVELGADLTKIPNDVIVQSVGNWGNIELLEYFKENNIDLTQSEKYDLFVTCLESEDLDIEEKYNFIKYLIDNNFKINQQLMKKNTVHKCSLFYVIDIFDDDDLEEYPELVLRIVKLLVNAGIDVNEVDVCGRTALIRAIERDNIYQVQLCADLGINMDGQPSRFSAIESAYRHCSDSNILNYLLITEITQLKQKILQLESKIEQTVF